MFGRKAVYFTIDALLAGFLLVFVALLIHSAHTSQSVVVQETFFARDITQSLDTLTLGEYNSTFVIQEFENGNLTDYSKTLLETIGMYWALNQSDKAEQLLAEALLESLPEDYGFRFSIDDQTLIEKSVGRKADVVVSNKMIAGIAQDAPLEGASASAFLRRIRNKKTSVYHYFGGFIGQGNITFFIDDLPADFSSEKVELLYLEGEINSPFQLYINSILCFSPTPTSQVETWDITSCSSSLTNETNTIEILFQEELSTAHVSGGFLRIDFRTDELKQDLSLGYRRYYFPEVVGVANIYDSFYIPGTLLEMSAFLHYDSNYSTYISVGERIIEFDDFIEEKEITPVEGTQWEFSINNSDFLDYNFDYEQLSLNTVPLRFASYEAETQIVTSGDADIILITDYSQSMMRAVLNWGMGNVGANCNQAFSDPETRRTNLAKCINNEFVDSVMNYSGNRVWPVFMFRDEIRWYNNPSDTDAIKGYINSYPNGQGYSCISCAINQAYDILEQYSNSSRKKVIVLMTDGVPTHCSDGSCNSVSVDYGQQICEGICNYAGGNCNAQSRAQECDACTFDDAAAQNLYHSSQRAVDDLNVTIFTVGFGPVEECGFAGTVLSEVASIGNGTYQHSNDIEELRLIYDNISLEIQNMIEQETQSVLVQGEIQESTIYGDSYIEFTYDPIVESSPGMISVVVEEELLECNTTINIPSGIQVVDAKVTSYSGNHWSDILVVNNETAFNLSSYYVPYHRLGDPFVIQVPVNMLVTGSNTIFVETGDSPENRTGCSDMNKFIYTALVPSITSRTDVKAKSEGCNWNVSFEDGTYDVIQVPEGYTGGKQCSFMPGNINYDLDDTYDVAMYTLLNQLDVRDSEQVFININQLDLEISTTLIEGIPYLWGPAQLRVEVWK